VLNVSKLSAGLVLLNHGDFSPCQEAKNTVRMFRDEVSARGVQLHFEEDQSLDALQVGVVRGDSGRFVQIIVNLISNAIKFTEAAPHPTVRVRLGATQVPEGADDGLMLGIDQQDLLPMCRTHVPCEDTSQLRLYVAVADSGLGMTEEEQSRLFQRFAQASPRTYGEFGGSGLGLVSDAHQPTNNGALICP
jgi:signal transduction histidine kinase